MVKYFVIIGTSCGMWIFIEFFFTQIVFNTFRHLKNGTRQTLEQIEFLRNRIIFEVISTQKKNEVCYKIVKMINDILLSYDNLDYDNLNESYDILKSILIHRNLYTFKYKYDISKSFSNEMLKLLIELCKNRYWILKLALSGPILFFISPFKKLIQNKDLETCSPKTRLCFSIIKLHL